MVLSIIPSFSNMIDYSAMKNSIIPRIKNLCLQTTSLSIRVNALVCLGKMLEHLDKYAVLDDIIPLMNQIPSREPPTLMAILGIFKQTMIHKKLGMDKDYLATKAIPFLFPLAVEPGLNLSQVTVLTYLQDTTNIQPSTSTRKAIQTDWNVFSFLLSLLTTVVS